MDGLREWLLMALEPVGLGSAEMVDYVIGVLAVEDANEVSEALADFLREATTEPVTALVSQVVSRWSAVQANAEQVQLVELQERVQEARAAERKAFQEALEGKPPTLQSQATIADPLLKQSVLAHAAEYQLVSDEEEDGQLGNGTNTNQAAEAPHKPLGKRKEKQARRQATAADLAADFVNTNRAVVAGRIEQQRDEARIAAAVRKERDKQALLADRERKKTAEEKRKAASQKQERRR